MEKQYKSIRVFKNPILEKFTHVDPAVPLLFWGPVVVWMIWRSIRIHELPAHQVLAIGLFGFFIWTLAEYVLHRFVFHYVFESSIGQRIHFLIHGIHHEDPIDPTRLVMPPVAAVILAYPLFLASRWVFGPAWCEPFFAFFLIGYLCYDYIHFYVHHFMPTSRIGKFLKQSHMLHHYVDPQSRWGVSSPFWDYVFGTYEAERERSLRPSERARKPAHKV